MDLRHVSSRELAGQKLKGYEKRDITYENLSADDVRRMEERGEIDCWVMALPNGILVILPTLQRRTNQWLQESASPMWMLSTPLARVILS